VVLAGLVSHLEAQGGWRLTYFRIGTEPDKNPFAALARALSPLLENDDVVDRMTRAQKLANSLANGDISLAYVIGQCRAANPGKRILLIADQFEEVFTLVSDQALRNGFVDALITAFPDPAQGATPDVCLILTLRADFYNAALRYRPLADRLQDHVENLGPMTRSELREAIMKPAETMHVGFEPGLVDTILDDVEKRPGSLPLLQFALREMWGRLEKPLMTRADYDAIGGVEGALAKRAQAIFEASTDTGKNEVAVALFRRLFTRLVTLGEGAEDTRRIVRRDELGPEEWALAQKLAGEDNRLVVTAAPVSGKETAEVAHEALIQNWPALVEWVNRDRAFQSWLRQLKPRVDEWREHPSDEGTLLRGGQLAVAEEWVTRRGELNREERALIAASLSLRATEKRQKGYRRFVALAAAIGVIIAVIVVATQYYNLLEAKKKEISSSILAATQDGVPLRYRLLMLVAASRNSEALSLKFLTFLDSTGEDRVSYILSNTFLRAPIFAGAFPAAIDQDGEQVAYLLNSNVVTSALPRSSSYLVRRFGDSPAGAEVSLTGLEDFGVRDFPRAPPTIGFLQVGPQLQSAIVVAPGNVTSGDSGLSAVGSSGGATPGEPKNYIEIVRLSGRPQINTASIPLGDFGTGSPFPSQVEIADNSIRVMTMEFGSGGLPNSLSILPLRLRNNSNGDLSLEPRDSKSSVYKLDWQPVRRGAPRIPTLASDCDKFAFLGPSLPETMLYVGNFEGTATAKVLEFGLTTQAQLLSSVAISRGCSAVVVHLSSVAGHESADSKLQLQDKLILFQLDSNNFDAASGQIYDVPPTLGGSILPSYPLYSPPLAGARAEGSSKKMRIAWLIPRGLAVVDLERDGKASGVLSNDQTFLTDLDSIPGNARLIMSKNANFLMIYQQRAYISVPDIRIFDLRIAQRRDLLSTLDGVALRNLACEIASFLPGSNQLSPDEQKALLRDQMRLSLANAATSRK
jgi:hypothetical protein